VDETLLDDDYTEKKMDRRARKRAGAAPQQRIKKQWACNQGPKKGMYGSLAPEQQASLVDFIGGLKKASEVQS
jgi:hypothetical protein